MPLQVVKVMMLYVGGTIGMQKNASGAFIPISKAFLKKLKDELHQPDLAARYHLEDPENDLVICYSHSNSVVSCKFIEYEPLLDSSNMGTDEWINIALDIEKWYDAYDGFVILHGTDTLCYTASALSFMLENLNKPVILTGSQISIFERISDAKANILFSIDFAANFAINEVCIFFADKLLRGNRTRKVSATHMNAFNSPNFPALAEAGITVKVNPYRPIKRKKQFRVFPRLNKNVIVITAVPTMTAKQMEAIIQPCVEGVILESFGAGNIPTDPKIMDLLKDCNKRGVLILNITQCTEGTVNSIYEAGKEMEKIGVIPGYDLTLEAALTKMCYVLAKSDLTVDEKKKLMVTDLCGELTNMDSYNNNNNNNNNSNNNNN